MKNNENIWNEKEMPCKNCTKGKMRVWNPKKKKAIQAPCVKCFGTTTVTKNVPKYCQYGDCESEPSHQCESFFCDEAWVCSKHWKHEDIGYSQHGQVCETCFDEIGSGGH